MDHCPLCGGTVTYVGLSTVECCTRDCENFGGTLEKEPKEYDWIQHMKDLLAQQIPPMAPAPPGSQGMWPSPKSYRRMRKLSKLKFATPKNPYRIPVNQRTLEDIFGLPIPVQEDEDDKS